jgi:hypothetical protein
MSARQAAEARRRPNQRRGTRGISGVIRSSEMAGASPCSRRTSAGGNALVSGASAVGPQRGDLIEAG